MPNGFGSSSKIVLPESRPSTRPSTSPSPSQPPDTEVVAGARNCTHGDKERSFTAIAELWTAYLLHRKGRERGPISARDVAQMMVLMKVARSIQGEAIADHFLDQAGYSAIAGELAAAENRG